MLPYFALHIRQSSRLQLKSHSDDYGHTHYHSLSREMDTTRDNSKESSKTRHSPNMSHESTSPVEPKEVLTEDEDTEDDGSSYEHVPFRDDPSLVSPEGNHNLRQDFQAPEALKESTGLPDKVTTDNSSSEDYPLEHTPLAPNDINTEGQFNPTRKGKEKETTNPPKLDPSAYTTSDSAHLRSRRVSEAAENTGVATNFTEKMKGYFAGVKSKNVAIEKTAPSTTTTPTNGKFEGKPEPLERSGRAGRNGDGLGPGEKLSTGVNHSSLSFANRSPTQYQRHIEDETCCTCDSQQFTESKREPWWWVMQTVFYYLVYCVCCDFATAVRHGSQISQLHVTGGHGSIIMFISWWQLSRFVLGMIYLGSRLSSGAAIMAVSKVAMALADRDAARSMFGKIGGAVQERLSGRTVSDD